MCEATEGDDFLPMTSAPRDGTVVEVRSARRRTPVVFRAACMYPYGLMVKCWVPVPALGQTCGGLPWKDGEVDGWRPVPLSEPAAA